MCVYIYIYIHTHTLCTGADPKRGLGSQTCLDSVISVCESQGGRHMRRGSAWKLINRAAESIAAAMRVCVYMYVCIYVYTCIYIHTYIYIYIYILYVLFVYMHVFVCIRV